MYKCCQEYLFAIGSAAYQSSLKKIGRQKKS